MGGGKGNMYRKSERCRWVPRHTERGRARLGENGREEGGSGHRESQSVQWPAGEQSTTGDRAPRDERREDQGRLEQGAGLGGIGGNRSTTTRRNGGDGTSGWAGGGTAGWVWIAHISGGDQGGGCAGLAPCTTASTRTPMPCSRTPYLFPACACAPPFSSGLPL